MPGTEVEEPAGEDRVAVAAGRLRSARAGHRPCAPLRDLLGTTDVALAYRVQQQISADRIAAGARPIGRKIGLTAPAVQQQFGVDQPDFGVLFDDMLVPPDGSIPMARLLQPRVEAEVAFVLSEDILDPEPTALSVRRAVGQAMAAIEIVDSRITDWDITITDTVADNASSGLFVLGRQRLTLDEFDPIEVVMSMTIDGAEVSSGNGRACLGDPLNALAWLARTAVATGSPLRAGDVILSGALGPVVPVTHPAEVRAEISALGTVSATFIDGGNKV